MIEGGLHYHFVLAGHGFATLHSFSLSGGIKILVEWLENCVL